MATELEYEQLSLDVGEPVDLDGTRLPLKAVVRVGIVLPARSQLVFGEKARVLIRSLDGTVVVDEELFAAHVGFTHRHKKEEGSWIERAHHLKSPKPE